MPTARMCMEAVIPRSTFQPATRGGSTAFTASIAETRSLRTTGNRIFISIQDESCVSPRVLNAEPVRQDDTVYPRVGVSWMMNHMKDVTLGGNGIRTIS
jgi:hypothetical protein